MRTITYHSQAATRQDEWVVEKARRKTGGYFVEIGAHDGLRHSNTAALEKGFSWYGLLVEANPELFEQCQRHRSSKTVQAVVGERDDERHDFVLGDAYGGLWHHMPEDWKREHLARCNRIVPVNTVSLATLLRQNHCRRVIDYLSLDVEGAELAILESYFSRRQPCEFRYITVEFRYDTLLLSKLEELLSDYELDEVRAFDACFVHKRLG